MNERPARFMSKLAEMATVEFGFNTPWNIKVIPETDAVELQVIDYGTGAIPSYMFTVAALDTFADMSETIIGEAIESIRERMQTEEEPDAASE
jgi:hypothetical protein